MDGTPRTRPASPDGSATASSAASAAPEGLLHATLELGDLSVPALRLGPSLRIAEANAAMAALLGVRLELLVGSSITSWLSGELIDHFQRGGMHELCAGTVTRADGTTEPVLAALSPIQDIRGLVLLVYGEVADGPVSGIAATRRGDLTTAMTDLAGQQTVQGSLGAIARSAAVVVGATRCVAVSLVDARLGNAAVHGLEMAAGAEVLREVARIGVAKEPQALDMMMLVDGEHVQALIRPVDGHEVATLIVLLLNTGATASQELRGRFDDFCLVARASLEVAASMEREAGLVQELTERQNVQNVFLTAVSHELRTPLTNVRGFAQTLATAGDSLPDETREHLLTRLRANAERLDTLLRDLLDLDRLTRGTLAPAARTTNLREVIMTVVEATGLTERRSVAFDLDDAEVHVEVAHVERVLDNLLVNAERYSPTDQPIELELRVVPGGAKLCISDHGEGIRPDLRERIFEPFARGDAIVEHAPGVGIGLTLVRRLVDLHHGRVWVTSRSDGQPGSSFHVFLPRRQSGASTAERLDQSLPSFITQAA